MRKKNSNGLGASAKKPSRASRATLRSGPAKKRGPSPSARSRKRKVWQVVGDEGALILPYSKPDNAIEDLKEVFWYAATPTVIGETYTLKITLITMTNEQLKNLPDCDGI